MNTTSIEEIRARFKPLTVGELEYHIYEELNGLLFGRVKLGTVWYPTSWAASSGHNPCSDIWDLVPVPQPELVVRWDKIPEWMDWFAIDESGNAYSYEARPDCKLSYWLQRGATSLFIPPAYYTNTGVPWDKSLRQRPAKS